MNFEKKNQHYFILIGIVVFALSLLASAYLCLPEFSNAEWRAVRLPRDMDQLRELYIVVSKYTDTNFFAVYYAYMALYTVLQVI